MPHQRVFYFRENFMEKIAFLIDGGFFLKRLAVIFPDKKHKNDEGRDFDHKNPKDIKDLILDICHTHLKIHAKQYHGIAPQALLYRIFFYDSEPYAGNERLFISQRNYNYANSEIAKFRKELHAILRSSPDIAVRSGEVIKERKWHLKPKKEKEIIEAIKLKTLTSDFSLTDDDFQITFKQKGVDMRIGLDIASLALKKHANRIILFSGDRDFIPAAKFARREGLKFQIDIMGQSVSPELIENTDNFTSSLANPDKNYMPHIYWGDL
jgi:uncharacterized LabA/DUF88 family protein